jgi:imidazolonepropionase
VAATVPYDMASYLGFFFSSFCVSLCLNTDMEATLIKNIKTLYGIINDASVIQKSGAAMSDLEQVNDAFLYIENGLISDFGSWHETDQSRFTGAEVIDAQGGMVLPCFVDSHTHIVFAKSREEEFVMRIKGRSYEEIAEAGGGILNSARKLQAMSEDELFEAAKQRLFEVIGFGTGAIEIKSGYGLTVADELKMLRVIKRLQAISPINIKSTFLGAHAIPAEYKQNRAGYVDLVINKIWLIIVMCFATRDFLPWKKQTAF